MRSLPTFLLVFVLAFVSCTTLGEYLAAPIGGGGVGTSPPMTRADAVVAIVRAIASLWGPIPQAVAGFAASAVVGTIVFRGRPRRNHA